MRSVKRLSLVIALVTVVLVAGLVCAAQSDDQPEQVIKITAKKFQFDPNEITVKKGVPVKLELTTLDRMHGFSSPDLGIETPIVPGKINQIRFIPLKAGLLEFHCYIFCGDGHETMNGRIIVTE